MKKRRRGLASRRRRAPASTRWQRWRERILTAGALAAAIAAIVGLASVVLDLRPDPDPSDRAAFSSIVAVSPVALSEHQRRIGAADEQPRVVLITTTESADDPGLEPVSGSVSEPIPGPVPDDGGTEMQPQPPEPPPSPAPVPTPSPAPVPPPTDGPEGVTVEPFSVDPAGDRLRAHETLETLGWYRVCATRRCERNLTQTSVPFINQIGTDENGDPIPTEEVAERVVAFLRETRTIDTPAPDGGAAVTEPVGVTVTANLELVGLRGRTVLLSWAIFRTGGEGGPLFEPWLRTMPTYQLEPTSDDDTTSVDVWVPLPRPPGPYVVRLTLSLDDAVLASGDSDPIE